MDTKSIESNKDLNTLANEVLKKYNIVPEEISIVQSGSIKTVWKFNSKGRPYCLKRLKQSYDKALFSVNAQLYIKKNAGNVPGILPDSSNNPIVQHNEQLFVVYEWIQGRDLNFNNRGDLKLAIQGLAKFHLSSKGYSPVNDSRTSTKLGKYKEQYASMKNKFLEWKEFSLLHQSLPSHSSYLKYVDSMVDLSDSALKLIEKSEYKNLTQPDSKFPVLCHQDYGKGNAILSERGLIVLDLDGVTFDLPVRDLRKIIGKISENTGLWEIGTIHDILDWYSQINSIDASVKDILYIDLLFPHWFYGLVKNQYQNNKVLKPSQIEKISKLEQSKIPLLNTLIKRGE